MLVIELDTSTGENEINKRNEKKYSFHDNKITI